MKKICTLLLLSLAAATVSAQRTIELRSPNGTLTVGVSAGEKLTYNVSLDGKQLLADSPLSMTLADGRVLGHGRLAGAKTTSHDKTIDAMFYKRSQVKDTYNELELSFAGGCKVIFRAYDDGVAYRFATDFRKPFTVAAEEAAYNFTADHSAWVPYVRFNIGNLNAQFKTSFESMYDHFRLSEWNAGRLAFSPLVVEAEGGVRLCVAEADLMNYPGMFLHNGNGSTTLRGVFAPYPATIEQGGHNELQGIVKTREDYIAKCAGRTAFPWRIMIVATDDAQLADNDMIYRLSKAPAAGDWSWVKPGKVAWDWWNDWNIYGVDFRAGINNDTYKYYIDFASANGIEYVILDEGWAVNKQADLMQVVPEIDLPMLVAYGAERGVGIILWAGYWAFDRDMEGVCRHYSEMGVKGFKIDFMDRDDQPMVDFHRRAAETCARYKLLADFHGTYKPTGLHRTYPNVLNYEGVYGLEQMKWSDIKEDQVGYEVTMPFVRMVAGPVDYTQGAMRNATRGNYRSVYTEAMSQGTRCRQLAQYVVFESPINMLCDSPSNYKREEECLRFIAEIPTVWDDTRAVSGRIGEHIVMARRTGDVWYVGGMTDWSWRTVEIDLSFLGDGDFTAEMFCDGMNADRAARDYKRETVKVPADRKVKIRMVPGGGFALKIAPAKN